MISRIVYFPKACLSCTIQSSRFPFRDAPNLILNANRYTKHFNTHDRKKQSQDPETFTSTQPSVPSSPSPRFLLLTILILIPLPSPILPHPNNPQLLAPPHNIIHRPLHATLANGTDQQHDTTPKCNSNHQPHPENHHPPQEIQDLHGD